MGAEHSHLASDARAITRRALRRWSRADLLIALALLITGLLLTHASYLPTRTAALRLDLPPVMLPLDDFHEVEQVGANGGIYRWTQRSSTVDLPNPGGRAIVQFRMAGGAGRVVPVEIHIDAARRPFLVGADFRVYTLLAPMPGTERAAVRIATANAAVREVDGRTLGVMVSQMRIAGGGAAPGVVLVALALATVAGYALLRQAAVPALRATGLIIAVQGGVLLWQQAGGWQYGLFGLLLGLVALASLGAVVFDDRRPMPPAMNRRATQPSTPRGQWFLGSWFLVPGSWFLVLGSWFLVLLLTRLPWVLAPDPVGDLELAARRMGFLYRDGLAGAYLFDGDYMPLRLYLLYGLSQLVALLGGAFHAPLPPVTIALIKLPGLLADLATIGIIYASARRWLPPTRAAALAALYACAPPVWINVAWWGQVDTLLVLPLVAMVVLLDRAGGRWGWLCWAVALLIKPQAIVFAPLLYVAALRLHGSRGIAQGGALAVATFVLGCVPLVLAGQGPGLMQAYLGSVGRFPKLTAGAYNLWYLITQGGGGHDTGQGIAGVSYRLIGLLLVGAVALLVAVVLLHRADDPTRATGAAVLALAFFCLPTQIHERYLFLALPFLALSMARDARLVLPFVLLAVNGTLNILGTLDGFVPVATPVIAESPLPFVLAVVNLGVLGGVGGYLVLGREEATCSRPRIR